MDVHGVGYAVSVPLSTFDKLPAVGAEVTVLTCLHVREDGMTLFGFATAEERQLFRLLDTVSGIGPKLALNVLSCLAVTTFCHSILAGDIKTLSKVNGIGKRTAERLVVELRDRVGDVVPAAAAAAGAGGQAGALSRAAQDAVAALETLGFRPDLARRAVQQVCGQLPTEQQTAESLIRHGLQQLKS